MSVLCFMLIVVRLIVLFVAEGYGFTGSLSFWLFLLEF